MTLVVAGAYRVPLEQMDAIRPHMAAVIDATCAEDGCIAYSYAVDIMEPGLIRVFEIWRDEASHKAHFETAHMKTWIIERAKCGLYDRHIVTYEIAAQHEI